MKRALHLARGGLFTAGVNPRVGCVIVKNGIIIGEGFHEITGGPHAEINALASVQGGSGQGGSGQGATVYISLEPCCHHGLTPPCTESLIKAKVGAVIICNTDPNPLVAVRGIAALRAAGITVTHGLLAKEGRKLNPGFFARMQTVLPYVRVKLAQSLDGRTAMASGDSYWITGKKARHDVQYWRARSHAILTGIGTVLQDDCRMSVRAGELPKKYKTLPHAFDAYQPMRVVLDTHLRIPLGAKILQSVGRCVVMTNVTDNAKINAKINALQKQGAEIIHMPLDGTGRLDLKVVLSWLGGQKINEVLVEAGAMLAGQFIVNKLADTLIIYTAPVLMGASARPLIDIKIDTMDKRIRLKKVKLKQLGKDWRITASL